MTTTGRYAEIPARDVPADIVFVTPSRNAGQAIETSYSTGIPAATGANADADHGDPFKRVEDTSDGRVTYYRWAK